MRNNASMLYSFLLVIGDFIALLAAFTIAYIIRVQFDPRPLVEQIPAYDFLSIFLALLPFWLVVFALLGLYNKSVYERRLQEYSRLFIGSVIGIMFVITYAFVSDHPVFPARHVPVYALALGYGLLLIERSVLRLLRELLFYFRIGINNVLLIGSSPLTREFAMTLRDTKTSGYRIVGYYSPRSLIDDVPDIKHYPTLAAALTAIGTEDVHTVIQTELYDSEETNQRILDAAQAQHVAYKFVPANTILYNGNNELELFHNFPVVAVHQTALVGWGRIGKRIFDIFGAVVGLIVAAPILLAVGLIIKLLDPKYRVFYKHGRVSRFGTPFYVYKLRSMYGKYSPGLGTRKSEIEIFREMGRDDLVAEWKANQKVAHDPRIMPIGRFIRKTSIDELPQLWNVLKGDLSLIGPRPVTAEELGRYKKASSLFLSVKPGITGLWQVSGRNEIGYDERIKLELYYVQNWSFLLDIKIMYRTLLVMLGGKGQ
jgi:exopolysaccharide biosynthesis polyprenyl glycosylphosphotransferase